jgi:hypothetical protein
MCGQVLLVRGEQRFSTQLTWMQTIVMPIVFLVASRWGVTGIAASWALVHPFFIVALLRRTLRTLDLSARRYAVDALLPAVTACAVMAIVVLALRTQLMTIAPLPRLVLLVGGGAVAYVGTLFVGFRDRVADAITQVRRLRGGA